MDRYLITLGLMLSLVSGFHNTEKCVYPMELSPSGLSAKTYMIGTKLIYYCDKNFEGQHEDTISYDCKKVERNNNKIYSKKAKWKDNDNCCFQTGSADAKCVKTVDGDFLSNEEETAWTDSCGPPPDVPNATLHLNLAEFPLGQELIYSLSGNDLTQDGHSGVMKCMDCNKTLMWVNMTDGCPRNYSSNKTEIDTMHRQKKTAVPRYVTILIITVMSLVVFGIGIWIGMTAREPRNPTKSTKSACEEENEIYTTVIPLNENKQI